MNQVEKIFCPVCQVSFVVGEEKEAGKRIICPVCGAVLVLEKDNTAWIAKRPMDLTPEEEIRMRIENFARLRGYRLNELKEPLVQGLLKNMNDMETSIVRAK